MPFIIEYLVKVAFCLSLVYLFYQLVLRRLTFYSWNRFYLMGYSLFAFFIPLMNISPVLEKNRLSETAVVTWIPVWEKADSPAVVTGDSHSIGVPGMLLLVVLSGMAVLLVRLLMQFISFLQMRKRAERIPAAGMNIYQVDAAIIPFSFGNAIFINRHQHAGEELEEIIRHEWVHVKQRHSIDILFAELLCLVNWFNPFAWLLRRAIRQNLEFIADRKVLDGGVNRKAYQYLLLKVTGNNEYSIATQFNFSSLKKRIAMMNKLRSHRVHLLRFLFLLPLAAVALVSFRRQFGNEGRHLAQRDSRAVTDTVPRVTQLNEKGYFIDIVGVEGNCTVLVRDRQDKEIARVPMNEWKERNEAFTKLYGQILPPPPPAPAVTPAPPPPPIPLPARLPGEIQSVHVSKPENKVVITLKNGEVETYNLSLPGEKEALEKKYGPLTPPPPVVVHDGFTLLNRLSNDFEITDKKAVIRLKDGSVENYDLTNKEEKAAFEKKYGAIYNISTAAAVSPTVVSDIAATPTVTLSTPLALTTSVAPSLTSTGVSTVALTPAPVVDGVVTIASTAPAAGTPVAVIDDYGFVISGKEDIVVTITASTTEDDLKRFRALMKDKGVELVFDRISFNKAGKLVSIRGSMKAGSSLSRFDAGELGTLVLAMIRNGDEVIFKVNRSGGK